MSDDEQRAERLLSGHPRPEDLDGPYGAVAGLLAAAARDEEVAPPAETLLGDLVAATASPTVPVGRRGRIALVAVVVAGSALGASAAAAANGSLPDPVQDVFHDVADAIGLDIPDGDEDEDEDEGGAGLERGEARETRDGPGDRRDPEQSPGEPAEPSTNNPGVGSDGVAPGQGGPIPGEAEGNDGTTGGGGVEGVGPDGTPPGQGGTIPGTGNTTPREGPEDVPAGQGGTIPGTGNTTPREGPEDVPPGQGGTIPADEHGNAPPTTPESGSGNGGGRGQPDR